jgi:hypothetical protein
MFLTIDLSVDCNLDCQLHNLQMQSISLWRDYLNFVQENDPSVKECSPAGISKARDLFERALTAAGLHVSEGNKLWEAYREFEQAIFNTIDGTDNQVSRSYFPVFY